MYTAPFDPLWRFGQISQNDRYRIEVALGHAGEQTGSALAFDANMNTVNGNSVNWVLETNEANEAMKVLTNKNNCDHYVKQERRIE